MKKLYIFLNVLIAQLFFLENNGFALNNDETDHGRLHPTTEAVEHGKINLKLAMNK